MVRLIKYVVILLLYYLHAYCHLWKRNYIIYHSRKGHFKYIHISNVVTASMSYPLFNWFVRSYDNVFDIYECHLLYVNYFFRLFLLPVFILRLYNN